MVITEGVSFQAFYVFTFRGGISVDDALVSHVSYFLADFVLVIGHEDALAVSSVFRIELHGGVESGSTSCEEVEDGGAISGI